MERILLEMAADVHASALQHLLPTQSPNEQAAFLFVRPEAKAAATVFRLVEWRPVMPDGLAIQLPHHIELADEERAYVIKRGHDLGASIVEMHSHRFPGPAAFSASDRAGLREFVPHVLWRLKRRPYLAVVVTPDSFDGLVWMDAGVSPRQLDGMLAGGRILSPSRISLVHWEETDDG